jgi:predicted dehydrogenase
MNENKSRREFLKNTGTLAAATTLAAAAAAPKVHAAEDNSLRVALIGCGGRGTGAAMNALMVNDDAIQLVALADVFEKNLNSTYASLSGHDQVGSKVVVPEEQKFIGFDAYKKAIDCLRPNDIAVFATPAAFRWVHYAYAIEKGVNVFMEKPVTIDGPTSNRMLELNKKAMEKNLKVAVGLMCRHCKARQELFDRIQNGEIGDVNLLRAYRMAGPTGSAAAPPNDGSQSELLYQIKHFHGFLWLSGGAVSDFLIHNIDEGCWMKNDWPVSVIASGGRHYRDDNVDQNFDTYSMEYTFADGAKMMVEGRTIPGCKNEFATYAHGTKGMAVVSTASHRPAKSRIYKGHNIDPANLLWAAEQPEPDPYQLEWDDLIAAIRENKPYNEVERGVMVSAVTSMGRMAAHTGQELTLEQFLAHDHEFAPDIENLTLESASPLQANAEGKYSVPMPGLVKNREYL